MELTRQQKRNLEREKSKKDKTYLLTGKQLEDIEKRAINKVLMNSFEINVLLPLLVLRKEGWGQTRGARFVQEMSEQIQMLSEDYFQITDIREIVEKEYGFEIRETEGRIDIITKD